MKSDVCTLSHDSADLYRILDEVEKTAQYNRLDKKETGRLRLLAEELIGMIPELLEFGSGTFWTESDGKTYELHVSLTPAETMNSERREKLLAVSSSGKNAAAVGIMNKIRIAAELMMLDYAEVSAEIPLACEFYNMGMTTMPMSLENSWSLNAYRVQAKKEKTEAWDELEKSIIATIADDVLVGIQGKRVDIIVKKTF